MITKGGGGIVSNTSSHLMIGGNGSILLLRRGFSIIGNISKGIGSGFDEKNLITRLYQISQNTRQFDFLCGLKGVKMTLVTISF